MDEPACIAICRIGETGQLVRAQDPSRELDPLHLDTFLALGVGTELEAKFLHLDFAELARAVLPDLFLVMRELVHNEFRDGSLFRLDVSGFAHGDLFSCPGAGCFARRAWPHAKKKPRLPTGTGAFSAIFLRRFLGNAHLTGEKPVPLEKGHTGTPTHAHNQV